MKKEIEKIKTKTPLFYYGLHFLFGAAFYLNPFFIIFFLLFFYFESKKAFSFFIFFLGAFHMSFSYPNADKDLKGEGILTVFGKEKKRQKYLYKARITAFEGKKKRLPAVFSSKKELFFGKYFFSGEIKRSGKTRYFLSNLKLKELSLSRYLNQKEKTRTALHKYIKKHYGFFPKSFFCSFFLGFKPADFIHYFFSKTGQSHLLAISGFHFGILFFLMTFAFSFLREKKYWIPLFILPFYFFLLPCTPSVLRSFIMIEGFLISQIIKRPYSPVNILGLSLFIELLIDPLFILHIGFQLSFAACIGIFFIYPYIKERSSLGFLKKDCSLLKKTALAYLKNNLLLSLSIYTMIFPFLFYHFQKISLLSFFYNLILPPFCILFFILFFIGIFIPFFHRINSQLIEYFLELLFNFPVTLEMTVYLKISSIFLFIYFFLLILFFLKKRICFRKD